jgi:hypothetical protein
MIYLTQDDLKSKVFEILLEESIAEDPEILDKIEGEFIALIQSKLNGRYDVIAIFEGIGDMEVENEFIVNGRHLLIVKVLKNLVVYEAIRRNAARKVPTDIKEDYKWAMDWLDDVKNNKEHPVGLPPKTDENGDPVSFAKWGNNRNENFYL